MTSDYPVVVVQDRYRGAYSGGAWLAIAAAQDFVEGTTTRAQFCLSENSGPSAGDVEAAIFWQEPPHWIAVGQTPDQALAAIRKKMPSQED